MSAVEIRSSEGLRRFIGDLVAQSSPEAVKITMEISTANVQSLSEALTKNQTLTSLSLRGSKIGGEGAMFMAEALKINRTLTSIDLCDNELGDKGAMLIAGALKANDTITKIDLSANKIGDEGAKFIDEALTQNKTLQSLYLIGNNLSQENLSHVNGLVEWNRRLYGDASQLPHTLRSMVKAASHNNSTNLSTYLVMRATSNRLPLELNDTVAEMLDKVDRLHLYEAATGQKAIATPKHNYNITAATFAGTAVLLTSLYLGLPIVIAAIFAVCAATWYHTSIDANIGSWVSSISRSRGTGGASPSLL